MCEDVQTALSARLDGEPAGLDADLIERHLAGCVACATWLDGARSLAVPALPDPPDLSRPILAAVAADPVIAAEAARRRAATEAYARQLILRIAVGLAAV